MTGRAKEFDATKTGLLCDLLSEWSYADTGQSSWIDRGQGVTEERRLIRLNFGFFFAVDFTNLVCLDNLMFCHTCFWNSL